MRPIMLNEDQMKFFNLVRALNQNGHITVEQKDVLVGHYNAARKSKDSNNLQDYIYELWEIIPHQSNILNKLMEIARHIQ